MTLIETAPAGAVSAEQVFEIKTMAESGQFADALIRLRKIKPLYPRNTFLVALEKQLERLLVLPRGSEPSEQQRRELVGSLPALVKGAAESLRQQQPARPQPAEQPPAPKPDLSEKEAARNQLKEQYFHHADEYLKKGAYGSALVEIRRVKIIAPDDPTVIEYERTIRQLVELQQRTGVKPQDQEQNAPEGMDSPRTGVEASPTAAPPVREFDESTVPLSEQAAPIEAPPAPPRHSRVVPAILAVVAVAGLAIAALALLSNPEQGMQEEVSDKAAESASTAAPIETPAVQEPAFMVSTKGQSPAVQKTDEVPAPPKAAPRTEPKQAIPAQEKADAIAKTQEPAVAVAPPAETMPVERDPEIVRLEQPIFPQSSTGPTGGEVIIMVQIDPDGKPIRTMVAKSTNPSLNSAIVTAVLRSTYRPATTPDGPATKWLTIPFRIQ